MRKASLVFYISMKKQTINCPVCGRPIYHHDGRSTIDKIVTCKKCYIQWRINVSDGTVSRTKNWDRTKNYYSSGRSLT